MDVVRIRLLGAVELCAGEVRHRLGSAKERRTLAALAWDAGRTVSVDTLIHRVWDDPPAKAREALYSHVARIRRAMQEVTGDRAPALTNGRHVYALEIDPDTVDLRRYLSLLDQAHCLADSHSGQEALRLFDEATGLWAGEPLAGMPGAWPEHLRTEVTQRNLAAVQLRAAIALHRGRYAEAVAELLPVAERHPGDESLIEQLALALYGAGRLSDATRLLQRARHHLREEAGVEPGEALQRVQQGILHRTPVTALLGPATRAAADDLPGHAPDTLPADVVWVGRQAELDRLTGTLTDSGAPSSVVALEAIDGMAGIGKTSLAVHAAHQLYDHYPDGRIFLDLRGHAPLQAPLTPVEALTDLLRQLGTPKSGIPQDLSGLTALWRTTVRHRRLVVILDDAAGPEQVRPLLPGASPALVIITSRHRLTGLPGVRPISLDVLPGDDAIALFQSLVGRGRAPGREDTAHIVRLCGHIPLAIEITASRLLSRPSWSVADLIDRFNRAGGRLPEIRDGHREMTQAFAVSYDALAPTRQRAFRRLGLHLGSEFGTEAAAALTGLPLQETERVLEELLACHLITEPSPHRYRLHDLLREYARIVAAEDGEDTNRQAVRRLLRHYLLAADRADRQAFPSRSRITVDGGPGPRTAGPAPLADPQQWFITEGSNLLAALEYVRTEGTDRELAVLTHTLAGFLDSEGYLATAEPLLTHAVDHWRAAGDHGAHARALLDLCAVATHTADYERALRAAGTALALARELRDEEIEAEALHQLSIPYWYTARYSEALRHQWRALQLRMKTGDRHQQARSLNLLGMTSLSVERHKESLKYFLEALSRFREVNDPRGQIRTLNNLAELYKEVGDLGNADRAYRSAMHISRAVGSRADYPLLQVNLAGTLSAAGKAGEALELYHKALPALRSMGDRRSELIALLGMAGALHSSGRSEEALPRYTAALALARRIQAAEEEASALQGLGVAEQATGRLHQARAHLQAGLALSEEIGARSGAAETMRALTAVRRALAAPPAPLEPGTPPQ